MHSQFRCGFFLQRALAALLAVIGAAEAHVVPNMTVEAEFAADRTYTLKINVDPRTFLAADPTTLPPVPGSWYREQTPEQRATTHQKAREYLSSALGVLFGGQKSVLPDCEIQAIDGADNNPLKADTQEIHLLATARGRIPESAATFQVDFAKEANTTLILLHTQAGSAEPRPQVIFPGETSRVFQLKIIEPAAPPPASPPPAATNPVFLFIVLTITIILGIVAWQLLNRHRHHHRAHRKPDSM